MATMEEIFKNRAAKTEKALKTLEEGLAAKAIEPGAFNDCSYWLKSAYDDEQRSFGDKLVEGVEPHQARYQYRCLLPYSMTHCAGRLKRLMQARTKGAGYSTIHYRPNPNELLEIPAEKCNEIIAFFEKWSKISDKLAKLKGMKVKKVSKKETEEQERKRWLAPTQSTANLQRIRDLLQKIIEKQYETLKAWSLRSHTDMYNALMLAVADAKTVEDINKVTRTFHDWHHFYETLGRGTNNNPKPLPKGDYAKKIKQLADRYAEEVRDHFIYKNMKKLAAIIVAKEERGVAVSKSEVIEGEFTQAFEGNIRFEFSDFTHFIVRNKIVVKYLQSCGQFAQYPTTFHHVKFADPMKCTQAMVPEEEMVEKWAKEDYPKEEA